MLGIAKGNRILLGMLALVAILGCSRTLERPTSPTESRADEVIAEAMRETARANRIAAELEKRFAGLSPISYGEIEKEAAIDDGKESTLLTLRWNGPLEPLARSLAESAGIELRIFGAPPAHPVFVSVHAEDVHLHEAIGLADTAAFGFAELRMDSGFGRMELRYSRYE